MVPTATNHSILRMPSPLSNFTDYIGSVAHQSLEQEVDIMKEIFKERGYTDD